MHGQNKFDSRDSDGARVANETRVKAFGNIILFKLKQVLPEQFLNVVIGDNIYYKEYKEGEQNLTIHQQFDLINSVTSSSFGLISANSIAKTITSGSNVNILDGLSILDFTKIYKNARSINMGCSGSP